MGLLLGARVLGRGPLGGEEGGCLAAGQDPQGDGAASAAGRNARDGNPWLDEVAKAFGYDIPGEGELLGHGAGYRKLSEVPLEEVADWSARRMCAVNDLGRDLRSELKENSLWAQYREVELPMIHVVSRVERSEMPVDVAALESVVESLDTMLEEIKGSVFEESGHEFDLEDQKELAEVLFDKMALAVTARPKNGALIGLDVLNQIAEQNPIGAFLRDHRELKALRDSITNAKEAFDYPRSGWLRRASQFSVLSGERILWMGPVMVGTAVSTFNRLLSEVEGLPNPEQRAMFRSQLLSSLKARGKDKTLVGVSIDQLQMRLAAHLSEDPALQKSFLRGEDLEAQLLTKLFPEEKKEDTLDSRRDLVDVLLGSIGEHRLARRTGMSPVEAAQQVGQITELFWASFPKMESFVSGQQELVENRSCVESLAGRRRSVPEISSRNSDIRQTAIRLARNAAIQSSAADLLKKYLVSLDESKLEACLVGQIRDQLIFEVSKKSADEIAQQLMKRLEETFKLSVPSVAQAWRGDDWASVEPLELATSAAR